MTYSKVDRDACVGLVALFAILAATICLAAGSWHYWLGWAFLINFALCSMAITAHLLRHDRALLARRSYGGPNAETEPAQKFIQSLLAICFIGFFVISGLDFRSQSSNVSPYVIVLGHLLTIAGFAGIFVVFRANSFASAIIEVAENQPLVDTGPYKLVRHPMYFSALLLLVGMPLALGSYWAMLLILPTLAGLIARIYNEELFLEKNLVGYAEYRRRTPWRLVPLLW